MAIKKYKPTSPGRRFMTVSAFEDITTDQPLKSLLDKKTRKAGRNNYGRISMRRRGGGHKKRYRIIDFRRNKFDVPAKVATVEYDPNRSANIALLHYADGEKRYILSPLGLKVGDSVLSSEQADITPGNTLPLHAIPLGTEVHNIELHIGGGGQMVRAAGCSAQVMAKEGTYAQIRMPSGEVRKVHMKCMATIGQVGNIDQGKVRIGKAGANRWRGNRPKVRGVVMNPVDHPHGGGEGRTSGGRHPVTPWGKPTKGYKTRKKRKDSNKYIVKRRK